MYIQLSSAATTTDTGTMKPEPQSQYIEPASFLFLTCFVQAAAMQNISATSEGTRIRHSQSSGETWLGFRDL